MSAGAFLCWKENLPEVKDMAGHNTRDRVRQTPKDRLEATLGSAAEGTGTTPTRCLVQCLCASLLSCQINLNDSGAFGWLSAVDTDLGQLAV